MITTKDWVYYHIPRTGGTSFKLSVIDSGINFSQPLYGLNTLGILNDHRPLSVVPKNVIKGKPVYSVVRNPYERAASFYTKCMTFNGTKQLLDNITFEQFYDTHLEGVLYPFSITQCELIDCDYDVKLYKYKENEEELEKATGIYYRHKLHNISLKRYELTQKDREIVQYKFYNDFKYFDYSFNT